MDILTLGKISAVKRETDKKIADLDEVITGQLAVTTELFDDHLTTAVANMESDLLDNVTQLNTDMGTLDSTLTTSMANLTVATDNSITALSNNTSSALNSAVSGMQTDLNNTATSLGGQMNTLQTGLQSCIGSANSTISGNHTCMQGCTSGLNSKIDTACSNVNSTINSHCTSLYSCIQSNRSNLCTAVSNASSLATNCANGASSSRSACHTCQCCLWGSAVSGVGSCAGEIFVWNGNHWSVTNGGKCCHMTVPSKVKFVKFEILGGGGPGGGGGRDYDMSYGGWGGNTAVKRLWAGSFTAGSTGYSMCAAATSQCSCCAHCQPCRVGCTSYVNGSGLSNFCATGGEGGQTSWDKMSNCYDCSIQAQCLTGSNISGGWGHCQSCTPGFFGADYGFTGTSGGVMKQYNCCADTGPSRGGPSGIFATGPTFKDSNVCTTTGMGCCRGHAFFPGGGGGGGGYMGHNACWGGFGASGLIRVTYG